MTDAKNSDAKNDESGADGKLKRKEYEQELARLHVEFVKLQQWVLQKGLKVSILFETAGPARAKASAGQPFQDAGTANEPTEGQVRAAMIPGSLATPFRSRWDDKFVSGSLQRRVRKLSVPPSLPREYV